MININEHYSTFLRGRNPLNFDEDNLDHPLNIEWYNEQYERCMLGYSHNGTRLTPNHYFYLNFVPILKLKEDEYGNPIGVREIEYPLWCQADDYVFKQIEEAIYDDKDVMLFSGRGWGKSFLSISFALYNYILIPNSESIISASNKKLVNACFVDKVIPCLDELEKRHLTWKQKRNANTTDLIKAGESIDTGTDRFKRGTASSIEKIIYNTEGETAGRRVNFHLYEEIGEWGKNPSLKDCINNTRGTSMVGSIKMEGLTMYIGTGGSVASDQAREVMFNPDTFNLYVVNPYEQRKHSIFMPVYTKFSGYYEKTGYCDEEGVKKYIQEQRKIRENDISTLTKYIQQFPLTIDEVFMKSTTRVFNSLDLADQTVRLQTKMITPKIDIGDLHLRTNPDTGTKFVEFQHNPYGRIKILKHPDKIKYKNLYCMGVDSIDIGNNESADKTGYRRSKLACLVKQRINPDASISDKFNNSYVAMYLNRADDVEDDYEQVMLLAMYYDCKVMLEFTKTTIKSYFKRYKQDWRFCKSPDISSSKMEGSDSIGFRATEQIIRHYIGLIKEYIKENSYSIMFQELCEQLIDYTYEEKGRFDLIAAMGGCEIHDEQLSINFQSAKAEKNNTTNQSIGYYYEHINGKRVKRYGIQNQELLNIKPILQTSAIVDYVDTKNNEIVYKK